MNEKHKRSYVFIQLTEQQEGMESVIIAHEFMLEGCVELRE